MKKVFTILIALVLLVSMMGAVSGVTEGDLIDGSYTSAGVPVTLTLSQSFEITLPAGFNFVVRDNNNYYADNEPFIVDVHRLNSTAILYVNVSSPNYDRNNNLWNLTTTSGGPDISYWMGVTDKETIHINENTVTNQGAIYLSPEKGMSDYFSKFLHVKIPTDPDELEVTGLYTDTLTFTVTIDED